MTLHPPTRFSKSARLFALFLLLALPLLAHAQHPQDIGLTVTQSRSNFVAVPGSATPYFYLRGAAADYNFTIAKRIGVGATAIGLTGENFGGHVDIHQVSILGGPRYTWNLGHILPYEWGRHGGIFGEGKAGYTFTTSGQFPANGVLKDSSAGFTWMAGGGVNLNVYHHFDLRLIEADFIRTQLPNGFNNSQSTVRIAIGVNFHTQD